MTNPNPGAEEPNDFTDAFEDDFVSKEEHAKAAKKAHDQELRAKKAEAEKAELAAKLAELEGSSNPTPETTPAPVATPDANVALMEDVFLTQAGYTTPEEKALVREAMAGTGQNIQEATANEYVVGKRDALRAKVLSEQATDFPGGGGGDTPTQDDLIVREFEKTGKIPNAESTNPQEVLKANKEALALYEAMKAKEGL